MAEISFPSDTRITDITWETWAPGRITHRLRNGTIAPAIDRGVERLRGTLSFGVYASWKSPGREDSQEIQTFLEHISDPDSWAHLPWGGEPLNMPTPQDWAGTLRASAGGVHTLGRVGTSEVAVGDWLLAPPAGRAVRVVTVAGTPSNPVITTHPQVAPGIGLVFTRAGTIRVRNLDAREMSTAYTVAASFAEGVTWEWEEL